MPARFAGVAQVAGIDPVSVTLRRMAGSQESSQSQLKGLLSRRLQIEIRDALQRVSNCQHNYDQLVTLLHQLWNLV